VDVDDQCQQFLFDAIESRRTVRSFKPDSVPEEHILRILDAARYAPTSGNQQPWKFLVIRDRARLDSLKTAAMEWYLDNYINLWQPSDGDLARVKNIIKGTLTDNLSAPVYVAVLVDSLAKYPDFVITDGTLAAGYLMIEARALGYGTGFYTSFFPEAKMKKFFNIPDHYRLICFTPIGIPTEWPEMPTKKPLDDLVVWEEFGDK
jgi:nitroreductase